MAAGLVKGEGFAVDASIIEAEAGSRLAMPGDEPHVCRIRPTASGLYANIWKDWTTKRRA